MKNLDLSYYVGDKFIFNLCLFDWKILTALLRYKHIVILGDLELFFFQFLFQILLMTRVFSTLM